MNPVNPIWREPKRISLQEILCRILYCKLEHYFLWTKKLFGALRLFHTLNNKDTKIPNHRHVSNREHLKSKSLPWKNERYWKEMESNQWKIDRVILALNQNTNYKFSQHRMWSIHFTGMILTFIYEREDHDWKIEKYHREVKLQDCIH